MAEREKGLVIVKVAGEGVVDFRFFWVNILFMKYMVKDNEKLWLYVVFFVYITIVSLVDAHSI